MHVILCQYLAHVFKAQVMFVTCVQAILNFKTPAEKLGLHVSTLNRLILRRNRSSVLHQISSELVTLLEAMSRARSSRESNDCSTALHLARSELRGAASSILRIVDQLKEVKQDTQEQSQYQESMINALAVENCQLKEENGAAKQLLTSNLPEYFSEEYGIEIKLVGEIDISPFINIYSKRQSAKLSNDATIVKATQQCSHWQEKLKDPAWSPFKKVKEGGIEKEIVDEEDVELKNLRREMGVSCFKAVKRGLEEINEHNPSGRYPVAKLWHVKDNREARMDEIVECMMKKTTPKRKRDDTATNTCTKGG